MFPQLIAGPIVQYKTIAEQMEHRKENTSDFSEGIHRFMIGLGKKVLIANNIGALWDAIAVLPVDGLAAGTAWLGALAYTFQIYFDFSGYSDMAIGLGKMFGFHFLENFNYPYISKSITEFWRRWHISLSSWFKEYVYIPLGGNRCKIAKQIRNILDADRNLARGELELCSLGLLLRSTSADRKAGAEKGAEPSSWNHSADLHHVFCGDRLDHFQMRRYGIWDLVSESHVWRIQTGPVE